MSPHAGSQLVDLCAVLLLLTCFAIVAQRRLSACVDLFALQSLFLAATTALVAFLTGIHHIYIAAALTIVIKVLVIPRILKKVIERLNVSRELVMNGPTSKTIIGSTESTFSVDARSRWLHSFRTVRALVSTLSNASCSRWV